MHETSDQFFILNSSNTTAKRQYYSVLYSIIPYSVLNHPIISNSV